jgi:hemerythrin superfamily protein
MMNSHTDIYSRLQQDHEVVSHLLEQLSSTTTVDTQTRQDRFKDLKRNLMQHSQAEDEVFYATLKQHAEARTLMQESEQDHQRIETLLHELDHLAASDPQWRAKLQSLKVAVDQHVHQEEGPVFAKARTLLTETQARELAQRFERAKDHTSVSSLSGAAAHDAPEAKAQAKAQARDMGAHVQHEAERLGAEAKAKGQTLLHEQQQAVAEHVGGLAEALHHTAQHLQEQHRDVVAQYTGQAAQGLERLSQTLRQRDLHAVVEQVEDFARRQPAVFIGSAALLGFLAARFLKSSAESRQGRFETSAYGGDLPRPQAPVGPGAPVEPAVTSPGAHASAPPPVGHERDHVTLGGN